MTVASNNPLLGFECRRAEVYLSPGGRLPGDPWAKTEAMKQRFDVTV